MSVELSHHEIAPETQSASATDLVLVPGWGMSRAVWTPWLPWLSALGRLHLLELPGHGDCPWHGPVDWDALAEAACEQVPEGAVWVGWSLGGQLALRAALKRPERVGALVLLASTPRFVQGEDWPRAMPADELAAFTRGLEADVEGTLQRFLSLQCRGGERMRGDLKALREALAEAPTPPGEALHWGLEALRDTDLRAELGQLSPPALLLLGEADGLIPAGLVADWTLRVPGARSAVVAGAAHVPFISAPARCAEHLSDFLDEVL